MNGAEEGERREPNPKGIWDDHHREECGVKPICRGLQGAVRSRAFKTPMNPGGEAKRPLDLVDRDFEESGDTN